MQSDKKLSIIVPVYNSEKYLERCLDRVLEQSYKNIEVIVINDYSNGNCEQIVDEYKLKDNRVKYIKHEVNKGLFQARITGASVATGEYIAFLDSDDYVSIDYYRTLMENIQDNNSDMAMGNMVLEYDDGRQMLYNLFNCKRIELNGEEIIREYFNQEGLSFDWHTIWNKIYKKSIWDKAEKHYKKVTKHLVMTEDIAFSTVLFYYAKKLTKVENDSNVIYYCQHEGSSTSVKGLEIKRTLKNIEDLITSFNFVENFLKEVGIYNEYKDKFNKWKTLYGNQHCTNIENSNMKKEDKEKAIEALKTFSQKPQKIEAKDSKVLHFMYSILTHWNREFEKIKLDIIDPKVKYVSFDIFDTLIKRPFWFPTDMFVFLSEYYRKIANIKTGVDFAKIRTDCECLARKKSNKQEITLAEIYETIKEQYNIPQEQIEKMKIKEIELELRFCSRRSSGYELYKFALAMEKKVICISDMYLPKEVINKILEKNGYTELEKVYVSSEYGVTKQKGDLYDYVMNELKITPEEMMHIGDNWYSDYNTAKDKTIKVGHLPKATEVATNSWLTNNLFNMFIRNMPFWQDTHASMEFIGVRTILAVCANKYFDNPYKSFNRESEFNGDPYLVGYYALGMYMFAVAKWLLEDTKIEKYNKLVFMARDGYLPMKVYRILKSVYGNAPQEDYVYLSRKALIPVTILDKLDFYKLTDFINITNHTPREILIYIKDSLEINENNFEKICEDNDIELDEEIGDRTNFNKFIKVTIENFYNEEKHKKNLAILRRYFRNMYTGKSATFDVGYSARPELYLSNLCEQPIDTYFLNINKDEALINANLGGFKLKTFFEAKPSVTGFTFETMISALAPSCIGYNIKNNEVTPVFEKYNKNYQEEFIVNIMQNAAIEFVSDMMNIFGEDIKLLYYQKYYLTLPIMAYINSSNFVDKSIFSAIIFEDDVGIKDKLSMVDLWDKELECKNQRKLEELLNGKYETYDALSIVENRSKPMRFIFYMLYDRPTFRRRMKEIFGKHKIIYGIGRFFYRLMRKMRNVLYAIIHKIKK